MTESALLKAVLLASSRLGARLFRNNVGVLQDARGVHVAYGLCKGSPDLVGWRTVTVTPDMVGRRVAVFVGLELKTATGRLRPEQRAFLSALEAAGGVAACVRSVEDAERVINTISCGRDFP